MVGIAKNRTKKIPCASVDTLKDGVQTYCSCEYKIVVNLEFQVFAVPSPPAEADGDQSQDSEYHGKRYQFST